MNKPKPLQIRPTRWHVLPEGEPIFSEMSTIVAIEDQDDGEYVKITQQSGHVGVKDQELSINDRDEWRSLCAAVDIAFREIAQHKTEGTE